LLFTDDWTQPYLIQVGIANFYHFPEFSHSGGISVDQRFVDKMNANSHAHLALMKERAEGTSARRRL
jgi:hypothetical protein